MRSVGLLANEGGVKRLVDQQFEVADQILAAGLIPIIEPEIDIHSPEKAEAEELLKAAILEHLGGLSTAHSVMLKLTTPDRSTTSIWTLSSTRTFSVSSPSPVATTGPRRTRAWPEPRRRRELLEGADRGSDGTAERRGVRRLLECVDRKYLRGVHRQDHLAPSLLPVGGPSHLGSSDVSGSDAAFSTSPALAAQGLQPGLDVVSLRIGPCHPHEEFPGPRHVTGPFVQVGERIPLTQVPIGRISK